MKTNSLKRSVLAVAVSLGTLAAGQAWAAEQFIPIPSSLSDITSRMR